MENAEVDTNSRIEVSIDKSKLAANAGDTGRDGRLKALEQQKKNINALLEEYGTWLEKRTLAVRAFANTLKLSREQLADSKDPIVAEFISVRDEADKLKNSFLSELIGRYEEDDAKYARIEAIGGDSSLLGLDSFFNDEMVELKSRINAELAASETTLRLEAFLLSKDADPRAIHLPKYDSLNEQRIELEEGHAFDLSPTDIAKLVAVTREVAAAAESARKKEVTWAAAFSSITPALARQLGALENGLRDIGKRVKEPALKLLVDETRDKLRVFFEEARKNLEKTLADRVAGMRESFAVQVAGDLERIESALSRWQSLVDRVQRLRNKLEPFDIGTALSLLPEIQTAAQDAEALSDEVKAILAGEPELIGHFRRLLDEQLKSLPDEVKAKILDAWTDSNVQAAFEKWISLYHDVVIVIDQAKTLLGFGTIAARPADMHVPEAFEVKLPDIENTSIDLTRTRRKVGDEVMLRATLTAPDGTQPISPVVMKFSVEQFGWHDSLEPSIVLVTPDRLVGGNDTTRFAPAIVWAWSYYPRAEEEGWWVDPVRFTQPSAGIHAVLLDFDDQNATEIGLGATLSLWDNRLQLGIGWNLMADGARDGQVYYYVGSSLIPLLQSLGIGKD